MQCRLDPFPMDGASLDAAATVGSSAANPKLPNSNTHICSQLLCIWTYEGHTN